MFSVHKLNHQDELKEYFSKKLRVITKGTIQSGYI